MKDQAGGYDSTRLQIHGGMATKRGRNSLWVSWRLTPGALCEGEGGGGGQQSSRDRTVVTGSVGDRRFIGRDLMTSGN